MIIGKRVTLRAIEREDLSRYVEWFNDPEVLYHLSVYLPMSQDDEVEWYEAQRKDSSTQNFAIVLNNGNQHIGSIGLMKINQRDQSAELGIAIGEKSEWRKGYGQEAIELLLKFSFNTLNLHRIQLLVNSSNTQGITCYEKCGFVTEGRLRDIIYLDGHYEDQLIMSVLRSEYIK